MKFTITLIAFIAAFTAAKSENPISITNNNVGNIVNVDAKVNEVISNNMETNIIAVLFGLLNQQAVIGDADHLQGVEPAENQDTVMDVQAIDPKIAQISDIKNIIIPALKDKVKNFKRTPEMIEKIKNLMKKE